MFSRGGAAAHDAIRIETAPAFGAPIGLTQVAQVIAATVTLGRITRQVPAKRHTRELDSHRDERGGRKHEQHRGEPSGEQADPAGTSEQRAQSDRKKRQYNGQPRQHASVTVLIAKIVIAVFKQPPHRFGTSRNIIDSIPPGPSACNRVTPTSSHQSRRMLWLSPARGVPGSLIAGSVARGDAIRIALAAVADFARHLPIPVR
ncbi:MAG: hypothetical protein ACKVS9_06975 [Phycisphaerae bacterium]